MVLNKFFKLCELKLPYQTSCPFNGWLVDPSSVVSVGWSVELGTFPFNFAHIFVCLQMHLVGQQPAGPAGLGLGRPVQGQPQETSHHVVIEDLEL